MAAHSSILASTNTSGGAPGVAGTLDLTMGKGGWGFGSELLFARSQLPHWWLPLPRLAPMQRASSAAVLQEAKASQLPCDGSFRQRVSTCHRPSTQSCYRGGYFAPVGGRITSRGEELDLQHTDVSYTSARQTHLKAGSVYSVSVCGVIDFGTSTTLSDISDPHRKEK